MTIDHPDDPHPNGVLARRVWHKLTLEQRRQYWRETDYGDHPERASAQLLELLARFER
jgi:hypothetical protein